MEVVEMESAQQALIHALLNAVCELGLISKSTYSGAVDLVHLSIDFPDFFRYPVCLTGGKNDESCKNPQ